jgi:hypothetical protein
MGGFFSKRRSLAKKKTEVPPAIIKEHAASMPPTPEFLDFDQPLKYKVSVELCCYDSGKCFTCEEEIRVPGSEEKLNLREFLTTELLYCIWVSSCFLDLPIQDFHLSAPRDEYGVIQWDKYSIADFDNVTELSMQDNIATIGIEVRLKDLGKKVSDFLIQYNVQTNYLYRGLDTEVQDFIDYRGGNLYKHNRSPSLTKYLNGDKVPYNEFMDYFEAALKAQFERQTYWRPYNLRIDKTHVIR